VAGQLRPARPGSSSTPAIARGQSAPPIVGTTLDGTAFDLASYRGRPVIVNFWGPSCLPCRDEFPLFEQELSSHAGDGLAIVGVLMDDPVGPARDFVNAYRATWPTVEDPTGALEAAYRAIARPQSYFIDATGVLRQIQVGQVTADDFVRLYASIAPSTPGGSAGSGTSPAAPGSSASP
jgi:cytochrome c biogenesis protein CcmG, thiol:disulfide interchange protein DsbE